jgi:hypothetical protein
MKSLVTSAVLLPLVVALVLGGAARARSPDAIRTPTSTPTATPTTTSTPLPSIPAPPSEVSRQDGVLRWVDNSSNEDGFQIDPMICGEEFHFTVGPNISSFQLPPEVVSREKGPNPDGSFCTYVGYSVSAFNGAGRSEAVGFVVVGEPPPPGEATASAIGAPGTGSPSPAEGRPLTDPFAFAVTGLTLLIAGVVARVTIGGQCSET